MTINTLVLPPVSKDHGVEIGLSLAQLEVLVEKLNYLKSNLDGHFHLTCETPEQAFGVVDLMFYVEAD